MPTPYGSRGGMAFGAEELRVLRRALALALHPSLVSAEDLQDCLKLAESVDEAAREGARLRAFLVADLARYRAALPGTAAGYLLLWRRRSATATARTPTTSPRSGPCAATPPRPPSWTAAARWPSRTYAPACPSAPSRRPAPASSPSPAASPRRRVPRSPRTNRPPSHSHGPRPRPRTRSAPSPPRARSSPEAQTRTTTGEPPQQLAAG